MNGEARRERIKQMLLEARQPLTGTALAGALHVSRQVIVQDIALMRVLPNMTVLVPSDATECYKCVEAAAKINGPVYIRLARLPSPIFEMDMPFIPGKVNVLREGKDEVLLCSGVMVSECMAAAELLAAQGKDVCVVNCHTIKPFDVEGVQALAKAHGHIYTVEEHNVIGGLGDAVADVLMGKVCCKFKKIGIYDQFGQSGKAADVLREYGLTADQIAAKIKETL